MKKKVLRSIICFLLSVILITECNLGAVNIYAAEMTDGTDSENLEEESDKDVLDETQEDTSDESLDETEEEEIITASSYLYPFEEAVTSLEELASTRTLHAVVYLADIITVRKLPEEASEPMKNLNSGDVVSIIGAGQDAEYNIWYQISYIDGEEEITGYVRKDNVACVDQEFARWQENYVRSIGMFSRLSRGISYSDVEQFPASYQDALYALKQKHPNWIFAKVTGNKSGVDWTTFVKKQVGSKSYIWTSGTPSSWKNGPTGETNWSYASEGIIKYYVDPRNWLSEQGIFQFELLGYHPEYHTVGAVESILSGSFMANAQIENNMTYAQAFLELGRTTDVSPFFLAARVLQEQGYQGNSPLISGKYPGYEGYYNYYNIGASGNNEKEVIENGLQKAKDKGWDSRYEALKAGVEFLLLDYIRVGQNTLYLQKFNMVGTLATHQYMQNIKAPSQEATMVHKAYSNKGLLTQGFIFRIPVYNNMPGKAAPKPGEEDKITLSSSEINNLQVDSEITLHPLVNGKEEEGLKWNFTSSNPEIATIDNNGVVKAIKAGVTTITCKCVDDPDNPNVGSCKITVVPADIDTTQLEIPILKDITYDPNVTLKDITLPTGYTWVNPDMVPVAAKSSYGVIYNPNEEKYNPITFDLTLNVKKKVLTSSDYTVPVDLEGGAGRELSSVSLPIGFYWNDPLEKLADTIGTKEYLASYNIDNANYESATDIKIAVEIVCEKHNFGEWNITEATCENDGAKIRKCTICGSKEELTLEKTGHIYESEITVEATEEAEGTRTYTCKNCGNSYTESIPKLPSTHVHKYEESVIKKASCTEDGEKAFECSCGDKYTEVIEAAGHNVENGRCQKCGYTDAVETPEIEGSDKPADSNKPNTGVTNTPSESNKPNAGVTDTPLESNKPNAGVTDTPSESNKPNAGVTDTPPESNKPNAGVTNTPSDTNKPGVGESTSNNNSSGTANNTTANNNNTAGSANSNNANTSNNSGNNNTVINGGNSDSSNAANNSTANNVGNVGNSNAANNSTVNNVGNVGNSNAGNNTTTNNTANGSTNNSNVANGNTEVNKPASDAVTNNNTEVNKPSSDTVTNNNAEVNKPSSDTVTNSNTEVNKPASDVVTNNNTEVNKPSSDAVTNNNSSTDSNKTEENKVTENKSEKDKKEEEKAEENKKEENKNPSTVIQVSTDNSDKTNQVEVELMTELMENAMEENTDGEKQIVSIQLNKNTEISQKIVEMAKDKGVDLEVKLSNDLKWTIKADSLSGGMPSAVNMNAEIVQEVIEKKIIETVASDKEYMELSLSHDGEFGFEATLTIPVEEKYVGQIANLFYFNEKTKSLEFQMAALVDDEQNIQLEFNHASDYVIVFALESMAEIVPQIDISSGAEAEEITKEMENKEDEAKDRNQLLIICLIVMILAGGLAGAGYFIYFNKKEISDGQDFEAWLKEEETKKEEISNKKDDPGQRAEKKVVSGKNKKVKEILKKNTKIETEQDDYLDDDVDDYMEKEVVSANLSNTGRILINSKLDTEEYLDDDTDDYLDDDVDDYVEKDKKI